jgi:ABC-2 type transport system permease protein
MRSHTQAPRQRRAGFGAALRSELTKIRTVRSTYWTLVATTASTVITGVVTCALIVAVLGAATITSEYSTGMIRASLTARPRRGAVFAAKAAAVALAVGLAASFTSFLLGQAILADGISAPASASPTCCARSSGRACS